MRYPLLFLSAVVLVVIAACSSTPAWKEPADHAPTHQVSADEITDAIPRNDPITRAGNTSPYTVLGQTYSVLPTSKDYKRSGIASWYGKKFHGRPTANGEKYNIYGMTAAHRTLPIPSYVKVTNLDNGRTAIVRVNDRGPFHQDREIDLSYAAAVKLGYADRGTAKVLVEAIDVTPSPSTTLTSASPDYFLQAGAFKNRISADNLSDQLRAKLNWPVAVKNAGPGGFYRVHIGPLTSMNDVQSVTAQLLSMNIGEPRLITE